MGFGGTRHAPAALAMGKRYDAQCGRGWVGPKGAVWTKLSPPPRRYSIPGQLSPQLVAILTELTRLTEANSNRKKALLDLNNSHVVCVMQRHCLLRTCGNVVPVGNIKAYTGRTGIAPLILNLSTIGGVE
jgi:hypothetical protein